MEFSHGPRSLGGGALFLEMNIVILNLRTALIASLMLAFFSSLGAPSFVAAADKTVVFVAGRDSHGFGSHEHGGGCRYLAATLEKGLPGIRPGRVVVPRSLVPMGAPWLPVVR